MTFQPDQGELAEAERRHTAIGTTIAAAARDELMVIVQHIFSDHRPHGCLVTNPIGCPDHDPMSNNDGFLAVEKASRRDRDLFKECPHCEVSEQVSCRSTLCCGDWPCEVVQHMCEVLGMSEGRPAPGELIASCPGRELDPNLCRCPCYGCKHHCSAHNPEDLEAPDV